MIEKINCDRMCSLDKENKNFNRTIFKWVDDNIKGPCKVKFFKKLKKFQKVFFAVFVRNLLFKQFSNYSHRDFHITNLTSWFLPHCINCILFLHKVLIYYQYLRTKKSLSGSSLKKMTQLKLLFKCPLKFVIIAHNQIRSCLTLPYRFILVKLFTLQNFLFFVRKEPRVKHIPAGYTQ